MKSLPGEEAFIDVSCQPCCKIKTDKTHWSAGIDKTSTKQTRWKNEKLMPVLKMTSCPRPEEFFAFSTNFSVRVLHC